jgi:hypothetical protein
VRRESFAVGVPAIVAAEKPAFKVHQSLDKPPPPAGTRMFQLTHGRNKPISLDSFYVFDRLLSKSRN